MTKNTILKRSKTKDTIEELRFSHREIKKDILKLLDKCENQTMTKAYFRDALFKIYLKVK